MVAVIFSVALLASLAAAKLHARSAEKLVVREALASAPSGFAKTSAVDPDTMLNLRVALAHSDIDGLYQAINDVSIPGNAKYGQHLTKSEANALMGPSSETLDAVNSFFSSNNIKATPLNDAQDWMSFSIPVKQANELFGAEFSNFTHVDSGKSFIRTLSYSLPQSLQGHVEAVRPTVSFASIKAKGPYFTTPLKNPGLPTSKNATHGPAPASTNDVPSSCSSIFTPACLQALYGIPATPATQSTNQLAVSGFIDQWAQEADLQQFLTDLRPDMDSATTFTLQTIDGGTNPQSASDAGVEADLDIQYTVGVATDVPVIFISVGDDNSDDVDGFLDIINYLSAMDSPPQVLTTSYAFDEDELPFDDANQLCNAYGALGARGVSILFASGDGGVSGNQAGSCTTFTPAFPATCPFVTAVGATTSFNPETAASFSGGGFSNFFATGSWQQSAVSAYLSSIGSTNAGLYNASGRGFPDISAQGLSVEIVVAGEAEGVAGTSCSTPIMASIVSLINDQLIAAGKSPLGFLNPFVYANPQAFTDITSGDNPGCGTNGFEASSGWDPVTGLGTPIFSALVTAAGL